MTAPIDISSLIDEILNGEVKAAPVITTPVQAEVPTVVAAAPPPAPKSELEQFITDVVEPEPELTNLVIPPMHMPEFTTAELVESTDIRKFATLVILKTARWQAKVKDRKASNKTADAFNAQRGAYESYKHLLAGCDAKLKAVNKAIDDARTAYYKHTLPWSTVGMDDNRKRTGPRVLANTLFFDFTVKMAEYKQDMEHALVDFKKEYPQLVEAAKVTLGDGFDRDEYPDPAMIDQYFDLSFDILPIPQGSDFKGLPEQQLDALARTVNDKTRQMLENAMQDVWSRLFTAVAKVVERLSNPENTFHKTLLTNVEETASLVGHLNVTGDPRVDTIKQLVEKHLTGLSVEDLRTKPVVRNTVAAHASDILSKMNEIGKTIN